MFLEVTGRFQRFPTFLQHSLLTPSGISSQHQFVLMVQYFNILVTAESEIPTIQEALMFPKGTGTRTSWTDV